MFLLIYFFLQTIQYLIDFDNFQDLGKMVPDLKCLQKGKKGKISYLVKNGINKLETYTNDKLRYVRTPWQHLHARILNKM